MTIKCECGRQWTGLNQAHCTSCHRHFAGVGAFDAHWRGKENRYCVDPATLRRDDGNPLMALEFRVHPRAKKGSWIWTMWDREKHGVDVPQHQSAGPSPAPATDGRRVA